MRELTSTFPKKNKPFLVSSLCLSVNVLALDDGLKTQNIKLKVSFCREQQNFYKFMETIKECVFGWKNNFFNLFITRL